MVHGGLSVAGSWPKDGHYISSVSFDKSYGGHTVTKYWNNSDMPTLHHLHTNFHYFN